MNKVYKMNIAGLDRELPICRLNDHVSIGAFVIFGDAELTVASATALLEKVPEFDVIVSAEAKGIPLAYEMARQSGKKYFVARKYPKLYMVKPVSVEVQSITTDKKQVLYMDGPELEYMNGKRILIVDDVISTGGSLQAVEQLVALSSGTIVDRCCILAEGYAIDRSYITYLEPLPLFFD